MVGFNRFDKVGIWFQMHIVIFCVVRFASCPMEWRTMQISCGCLSPLPPLPLFFRDLEVT